MCQTNSCLQPIPTTSPVCQVEAGVPLRMSIVLQLRPHTHILLLYNCIVANFKDLSCFASFTNPKLIRTMNNNNNNKKRYKWRSVWREGKKKTYRYQWGLVM